MQIHNFRPHLRNLNKSVPLYLFLITVFFLGGQPAQALAKENQNTKRDEASLIGKTTLQELLMRHPNASQIVKLANGTSVVYAYKRASITSKFHSQFLGANAIELSFDKNQILSTINLIEFDESKQP
jgi:hypothetical protein